MGPSKIDEQTVQMQNVINHSYCAECSLCREGEWPTARIWGAGTIRDQP